MHLIPSPIDIDPVGRLLRDLDNTTVELQLLDPQRLRGDAITIDTAILGLTLVQRRIAEVEAARMAAE